MRRILICILALLLLLPCTVVAAEDIPVLTAEEVQFRDKWLGYFLQIDESILSQTTFETQPTQRYEIPVKEFEEVKYNLITLPKGINTYFTEDFFSSVRADKCFSFIYNNLPYTTDEKSIDLIFKGFVAQYFPMIETSVLPLPFVASDQYCEIMITQQDPASGSPGQLTFWRVYVSETEHPLSGNMLRISLHDNGDNTYNINLHLYDI